MPTLTVVAAPQATIPPHSLVRSADTTRDGEPGWERGLTYLPETTGGYRAVSGCYGPDQDHTLALPPKVTYQPWELEVIDPCENVFQYNPQEVTDRITRAAAAVESFAIANELMTGELAQADSSGNTYLTDEDALTVLTETPVSPLAAIGLLEQAVGDELHGQQAFLHVPRVARPYLWTGGTVQIGQPNTGVMFYTSIGSVIVSDAGYSNIGPGGATPSAGEAWMYATGPVVVRRSGLFFDATANPQVISTKDNTLYRKANKVVAAHFDSRALFAVPVTLS